MDILFEGLHELSVLFEPLEHFYEALKQPIG